MLLLLFLFALAAGVAGILGADPVWMVGTQAAAFGTGWLLLFVCDIVRGRPGPLVLLAGLARVVRRVLSRVVSRWLLAAALRRPTTARAVGTGPAWGRIARHRRGQ